MTRAVKRVVKLGGSLLDLEGLTSQLETWLARQSPALDIVVVGGGAAAQRIRRLDEEHQLRDAAAHWLAVEAMSENSLTLAERMPSAYLTVGPTDVDRQEARSLLIFDPLNFLRDAEPTCAGEHLPQSWDVTSDSIAARLAEVVDADELVLLKSALPAARTTYRQAADCGYVDRFFPRAATGFTEVRCVNLRDSQLPEARLAR